MLQEEESLLPTPQEIFSAFEEKFTNFIELFKYGPIVKFALEKGFDILKKNKYSAFEIRMVLGIGDILGEDFGVWDVDRQIDFIHKVTCDWCDKNDNLSKNYFRFVFEMILVVIIFLILFGVAKIIIVVLPKIKIWVIKILISNFVMINFCF